jgi:hypothetical protein
MVATGTTLNGPLSITRLQRTFAVVYLIFDIISLIVSFYSFWKRSRCDRMPNTDFHFPVSGRNDICRESESGIRNSEGEFEQFPISDSGRNSLRAVGTRGAPGLMVLRQLRSPK